jgi:CO/xanthine dehydrogenase Mo-binding subunit
VPEADGRVTVYVGSQGPWEDRRQVAAALGLAEERVRIAHLPLGGGFGGKEDVTVQIIAALAALKTGRPVRLRFDRRESIRASVKRHAASLRYTTGVKKDGQITAIRASILADSGAYASVGEVVIQRAVSFGAGPYVVPHADIEALCVYTNNPPGGAMRGFGNPQATFAAEVQLNRLAERLGLDPFEIRLANILEEGRPTVTGERIRSSVGPGPAWRPCAKPCAAPAARPADGWKAGPAWPAPTRTWAWAPAWMTTPGRAGDPARGPAAGAGGQRGHGPGLGHGHGPDRLPGAGLALLPGGGGIRGHGPRPASLITTASRQTFVSGNAVLAMARELKARLLEWLAGSPASRPRASRCARARSWSRPAAGSWPPWRNWPGWLPPTGWR